MDCIACQAPLSMDFPGKITGVRSIYSSRESSWPKDQTCVSCTAGRFLTTKSSGKPWSESCLVVYDPLQPHGLYSPWNSPGKNTEWVAMPFSRGSSWWRDQTQVSCIEGKFFTVQLFATLWTVAHQTPLSMGFSRHEYWSGLPCPPRGDLPDPGIKPVSLKSPAFSDRFFTTSATWEAFPLQTYLQ